MGCAAEVISLGEVRARKQWETLRQHLHDRFDQWLDGLETQLPEPEATLGEVCETIWALRQQLTGGLAETIVQHTHAAEQRRQHMTCPICAGAPAGSSSPAGQTRVVARSVARRQGLPFLSDRW